MNPRIVYCSTSGYGQTGPARGWAGHDLNYLAVGGYLHTSGRGAGGEAAAPGRDHRRQRRGRHARGALDPGRAARARAHGRGRSTSTSRSLEGVLSLMSLSIDEHLATGASPAPATTSSPAATPATTRIAAATAAGSRSPRSSRTSTGTCARRSAASAGSTHQNDDAAQDEIRADFAAAFATRDRDDWVAELAPADTCVAPVHTIEELAPRSAARGARRLRRGAATRAAAASASSRPRSRACRARASPCACATPRASDTEALLAEAGLAPRRRSQRSARAA